MTYTREQMKTMDHEPVLHGLQGKSYDIAKALIAQIDYASLKNDITVQCIAPIIRCIVTKILPSKDTPGKPQLPFFRREEERQQKCIEVIDVAEIAERLDEIYTHFLPIAEIHFPKADMQAELSLIFCNDYVYGLIEKPKHV